jgi:hypothetical protein
VNSTSSWNLLYQTEIDRALQARLNGNEGMARVCARRAAGIIIGEYLLRLGLTDLPHSSYDRISIFYDLPNIKKQWKDISGHFLLKVNPDHKLPVDVDLISEAMWLENTLLKTNKH